MIINIEVRNRTATYRRAGNDPVCGSNGDIVKFDFDAEWETVETKTARFIWGNQYYDQEFTGNSCFAPMFRNVTKVYIGVYAGEPALGESSLSTTKALIPYELSVRCGYTIPSPESGSDFTNEAKGYAIEALAASTAAQTSVLEAKKLLENTNLSINEISEKLCFSNTFSFSNAFKKRVGDSPQTYRKLATKWYKDN